MKRIVIILVLLIAVSELRAQYIQTSCFIPDKNSDFDALITAIAKKDLKSLPIGERISAAGKLLLDRPYIEKSLEITSDESLTVCNFSGFDCVTFFENAWGLAIFAGKPAGFTSEIRPDIPIEHYRSIVTNHRYRDGIRNGFQSRLHYTSDYFYDNAKRGNLKEMTREIGGSDAKLEKKPINFMTKHPNLYAQLANDPAMVAKMDSIEKIINVRGGFYYIPKEDVEDIEKGIQTGDIIGITTNIPGIDCSHTGIAIREKDGRIHFMHASSAMHKVIISPTPLAEYLAGNSHQTGIMVYRPLEQK